MMMGGGSRAVAVARAGVSSGVASCSCVGGGQRRGMTLGKEWSPGEVERTDHWTVGHAGWSPHGTAKARPSRDAAEARRHMLAYAREVFRTAPEIIQKYRLGDMADKHLIRQVMAAEFRKHSGVTDPKVVDYLLFRSRTDFADVMAMYKQRHHILKYLDEHAIDSRTASLIREREGEAFRRHAGGLSAVAPPTATSGDAPKDSSFLSRFYANSL